MQSHCLSVDWSVAVELVENTCHNNIRRWGRLPDQLEASDVVSGVYLLLADEFDLDTADQMVRRETVKQATELYLKRTRDAAWQRRRRRPTTQSLTELDWATAADLDSTIDVFDLDLSPFETKVLGQLWESGSLTTIELEEKLGIPRRRISEIRQSLQSKLEDYFRS